MHKPRQVLLQEEQALPGEREDEEGEGPHQTLPGQYIRVHVLEERGQEDAS